MNDLTRQAKVRANGLSEVIRWEDERSSKMRENGSEVKSQRSTLSSRTFTMILAGDIGGTKTLLGLFDAAPARPRAARVRSFGTLDYDDLTAMIAEFLERGRDRRRRRSTGRASASPGRSSTRPRS